MSDEMVSWVDDDEVIKDDPNETWDVMIADDEPDVHTSTKFAVSGIINGGKIIWHDAMSGKQCIEYVKHHKIDLIFLDVVMETPTAGLDAARTIRSNEATKSHPIIILRSGQAGLLTDNELLLNKKDFDKFIPKSTVNRQTLIEILETYLK
jgi:CheY-like chemotaxis protein